MANAQTAATEQYEVRNLNGFATPEIALRMASKRLSSMMRQKRYSQTEITDARADRDRLRTMVLEASA